MKAPRERDIEDYLTRRVTKMGGEVRKVQWVGRRGAPDRLVMLPYFDTAPTDDEPFSLTVGPLTIWVELKAPGEKCKPHQLREHVRMRNMGQRVVVIDSFEGVDGMLV